MMNIHHAMQISINNILGRAARKHRSHMKIVKDMKFNREEKEVIKFQ